MKRIKQILNDPRLWTLHVKIVTNDYRGIKEILRRELPSQHEARLLDLGCGSGGLTPFFREYNYVGVDINVEHLRFARERTGEPFVLMNAERLGFGDGLFDCVVAIGLCHHLSDDELHRFLIEVRRVCKPQSTLITVDRTEVVSQWNLPGRLLRVACEQGKYVRRLEAYRPIMAQHFFIQKDYVFLDGLIDYCVFVLRPTAHRAEAEKRIS